ncbi:MAG: alpha/beta hydrolase-fold protein [Pseudomonadota bacterium]
MAIKRADWSKGRLVTLTHDSEILADNPLGDPATRSFPAWLPPQYDQPRYKNRRFPVLYDLVGYTSGGWAHTNWRNFDENVPERCARLLHEERMGPAFIVFPDCFTALGGNQYINSSAIGDYADYLTRELVPFVDGELRTLASREHRGCFGKSSGGYGAIIHGMKYARYWGAIANHSGDALFDFVYRSDWPNTLTELARYAGKRGDAAAVDVLERERNVAEGIDDGRAARFLEKMWKKASPGGREIHALMNLCMAATYDPDPSTSLGFRLPFNLETGELIPERWRNWLRHDPARLVRRYRKNLATLKGIFIDCGWRDQYHIHYGTRVLSKQLKLNDIEHVYEEYDGTHSGIDYRMDVSLPFLYDRLKDR